MHADPTPDDSPLEWDATTLSSAILKRRISCREVMRACLTRVDRLNPRFNAIVSRVETDALLRQADACDQELASGNSRGWMQGFPMAAKDLTAVATIPPVKGSAVLRIAQTHAERSATLLTRRPAALDPS